MSKGPLVTRTELRKRREAEEKEAERRQQEEQKQKLAEKAYKRKEKEISTFYRKEKKKQKPINKSRVGEYSKRRERSTWLNKAIIIVAILLAVVAYIVLNL
ncbi:TPA: hypothetical protein OUC66_002302 [Enterococcus faecalis]|nr:hypothetical protein [Enterococcus faecalis]